MVSVVYCAFRSIEINVHALLAIIYCSVSPISINAYV